MTATNLYVDQIYWPAAANGGTTVVVTTASTGGTVSAPAVAENKIFVVCYKGILFFHYLRNKRL